MTDESLLVRCVQPGRVRSITAKGIHGYIDHSFNLEEDNPTILTGKNGVGKTVLAELVISLLSLDTFALEAYLFEKVQVVFQNGLALRAKKQGPILDDESSAIRFEYRKPLEGEANKRPREWHEIPESAYREKFPPWLHKVGRDRWVDERNGDVISRAEVFSRFRSQMRSQRRGSETSIQEVPGYEYPVPLYVDTKRLDSDFGEIDRSGRFGSAARRRGRREARVNEYVMQIGKQHSEARNKAVAAAQQADATFPKRAIEVVAQDLPDNLEEDVRKLYRELVDEQEEMARVGLAEKQLFQAVEVGNDLDVSALKILKEYLKDWEKRLEPLRPVYERISTLLDLLNSKVGETGKVITYAGRGKLTVESSQGSSFGLNSFSSGEQHLVSLYIQLMFSTSPGSFVVIDEPEISLHASWKHQFLEDVKRISVLNNLQVVLITHSTGIVNGKWPWVRTLRLDIVESGQNHFSGVMAPGDEEEDAIDDEDFGFGEIENDDY